MALYINDTERFENAVMLPSRVKTSLNDVQAAWEDLTESGSSLLDSIGNSGDAYLALVGTTGQVADELIRERAQQIIARLTATRRVKVKELLQLSAAASSYTWEEFLQIAGTRFVDFAKTLPEVLENILKELGSDLINDRRIRDSLFQLEEVQAISTVVIDILSIYRAVRNVVDKFEPYFPYLEIVVDAALIFFSGGATVPKMTSEAAQLAIKELQKAIPLMVKPFKDMILNAELDVPLILLGGLQELAAYKPRGEWDTAFKNMKNYDLISDAKYAEITNELKFQSYYKHAISTFESKIVGNKYIAMLVGATTGGRNLQFRLKASDYYFTRQGDDAPTAASRSFGTIMSITTDEAASISRELLEAADAEGSFYANQQMHKLIVEELEKDGAIVDAVRRTYDEKETYRRGARDRAAFKTINDTIIDYHKLLRALCGETRADIYETIPVIDFYRKEYTGMAYRYEGDNHTATGGTVFDRVSRITMTKPGETTALDENESIVPHDHTLAASAKDCTINLALLQYDAALHFYNTTADLMAENNLQVDHGGALEPKASALLNGLFTSVADFTHDGSKLKVSRWRWLDDEADNDVERALSYGISIPYGVRYNDAHLVGRGTVVPYPLATTTVGYDGKATEIYDELTNIVDTEIINKYKAADNAVWKTRGNMLQMATSLWHAAPREEDYTYSVTESVETGWWWPFNKQKRTVERQGRRTVYYARYPKKVQYFASSETAFNAATLWTNKNQIIESAEWLVLSDADPTVTVTRAVSSWFGFVVKTSRGESLTDSQSKLFEVVIRNNTITQLTILNPLEVLFNSHSVIAGQSKPKTALFIPDPLRDEVQDTSLYFLPRKMYLLSEVDLGLSLAANETTLCSFIDDSNVFLSTLTAVHYVNPTTSNISVTYQGTTFTSLSADAYRPNITVRGSACYIYELSNVQLSHEDSTFDIYPLKASTDSGDIAFLSGERYTSEEGSEGYVLQDIASSLIKMPGQLIVVGLPTVPAGGTYASFRISKAPKVSLHMFDTLLNNISTTARSLIYDTIKQLPIIEFAGDSSKDLPLEKLSQLLAPWKNTRAALDNLVRSNVVTAAEIDVFRKQTVPRFAQIETAFKSIFSSENSSFSRDQCVRLDSLLGQNAATPWLAIGSGASDDVSEETLDKITDHLRLMLEGDPDDGPYSLRYVEGDPRVTGRPSSLYYQRYMFLNNRLHKTRGHLAKAAMLLKNWQIMRSMATLDEEKIDTYQEFLNATPVVEIESLQYIDSDAVARGTIIDTQYQATTEESAIGGKFFSSAVLEHVRNNINNQCLLVCRPCPVKEQCPFYDEERIILDLVPQQDAVELWLKDNELDLLVYESSEGEEYLDLYDDNHNRLDASVIKDRHKVFVEIVHDPSTDYSLEVLRNRIADRVDGFYTETSGYVEDFAWLQGGRYGTLRFGREHGEVVDDPLQHSYLYDAVFIDDEETAFSYTPSTTRYPVEVVANEGLDRNVVTYRGTVRLKIPTGLKMLDDAPGASEVYLVSDDTTDGNGVALTANIYINTVQNLKYAFDLREDPADEELLSADDLLGPRAKDIAQWSANYYKTFSDSEDQYWMKRLVKKAPVEKSDGTSSIITVDGRRRGNTVIDTLIASEPPLNDVLRGKPFVNVHHNFLRKMLISLDCFQWVKGGSAADIEKAKKSLPHMKTNLRLVVIRK